MLLKPNGYAIFSTLAKLTSVVCKNISNALKRCQDFFALNFPNLIVLYYLPIEKKAGTLAGLKVVWLKW